jgi:peptidoglycan/LPS O-acetylase OafA/YrhL
MSTKHGGASYRHDIDGLRGVAIALVAVYHVVAGSVSGGVDVFLTLSGFFLATSLLARAHALDADGRPPTLRATLASAATGLTRIARRLVPAAVVTLAGTMAAALVLLPSVRWEETARQVLSSLTYTTNRHLAANELDYEAAGLAVSPVQHFWSLSVQGQVFLAVTVTTLVVVWLARRVSPRCDLRLLLLTLFAALGAASFAHALSTVATAQPVAYYDTLARGWELMAGAAVAMALPWLGPVMDRVPPVVRGGLGWLALAAVLTCGLLVDGQHAFPGAWTLWPVLATLTLLLAGTSGRGPERVLASRVPRWLGEHAYAFYLWHWPALVIYLAAREQERVTLAGGAGVLVLSLALAALTRRLVEDPLRRPGRVRPSARVSMALVTAATAVAVLAPVGLLNSLETRVEALGAATPPPTGSYPGAAVLVGPAAGDAGVPAAPVVPAPDIALHDHHASRLDGCVVSSQSDRVVECVYGDRDAGRTVALVGGSHAGNVAAPLDLVGQQHGFAVHTFMRSGCPWAPKRAAPTGDDTTVRDGCLRWSGQVTDRLLTDPPDLVMVTGTRPRLGAPGDWVPPWYPTQWRTVVDAGIPLVAIRDNPWLPFPGPECVADAALDVNGGAPGSPPPCSVPRDQVLSPDFLADAPPLPEIGWVDLSDAYCRLTECRAVEGNVLIYRDDNHITATYGRTLAPELARQLGAATGWW